MVEHMSHELVPVLLVELESWSRICWTSFQTGEN